MNIKIIFTILIIGGIVGIYIFGTLGALEESPVMRINLVVKGDLENPVIDINNTTRSVIMVPALKQKQTENPKSNAILADVFYNTRKISNTASAPYSGEGNYLIDLVFHDGAVLPVSDNETVLVWIRFAANGKIVKSEYVGFRWINSTLLQ